MNRRVVVTGARPLARGIATGLGGRGARIALVAPRAELDDLAVAVAHVACEFDAEADVTLALDRAREALGGVDQVVHTWITPSLVGERPFVDVDEAAWRDGCERSMEAAWWVARCSGAPLAATRGSLVFVVPTVGMSGGAGFAMLAAYAESARVLAKGCGRQWGGRGVTANTLATAPHHWVAADAAASLTRSVSLSSPAFGGPGDTDSDLSPLIDLLASPDAHFLTASTMVADGGIWMGL